MTRNNLTEHLSWFLRVKPNIPPPVWTPPSAAASTESGIRRDVNDPSKSPLQAGSESRPATTLGRQIPRDAIRFAPPSPTQPPQQSAAQLTENTAGHEGNTMVRLRADPKSSSKGTLLTRPGTTQA